MVGLGVLHVSARWLDAYHFNKLQLHWFLLDFENEKKTRKKNVRFTL